MGIELPEFMQNDECLDRVDAILNSKCDETDLPCDGGNFDITISEDEDYSKKLTWLPETGMKRKINPSNSNSGIWYFFILNAKYISSN